MSTVRVRVPCSTSNLGAGFDCIGLALDRYLRVSFRPGGNGIRVERSGTLSDLTVRPEGDAVVAAFRAGLGDEGEAGFDGVFRMDSTIPVARGLGSSAAATVAGLMLARMVSGRLNRTEVLDAAARLEGHPDNAAPCLMGGLVGVSKRSDGGYRAFALRLSDALGFAFAAPPVEVSTARARRSLPANVPHAAAVRGLGRTAALVHGLESGDPELLSIGFEDELHVPFRLPLIPQAEPAMAAAKEAGAHAVTISGSGSGLIAVTPPGVAADVAAAMAEVFRGGGDGTGVIGMVLSPDRKGALTRDSS